MPIETNLPVTVYLYLQLIQNLMHTTKDHDSLSKEAVIIQDEIDYYLKLIREEMVEFKKESSDGV